MHSGGITMGLCKLCTFSLPNYSPLFLFFFLPSFPPELPFLTLSLSSYSPTLSGAPFTRSLLKPGKKAQRQQLAALFSRAGIEGAGSSLHERAPLLRLHSALPLPPLFTEALLCQEQGSTERKEGSPFSLFVLRIAIQALPKPPLMSWPLQCCERREKEAGL